jgi:glycerophosphoryl diester phosphodiesterase
MEIDAALTADLVLVALHDRDLQQMLGQSDAKVGVAVGRLAAVVSCDTGIPEPRWPPTGC